MKEEGTPEDMRNSATIRKILTIAGSDCSGGAGIQADIKTIAAHGHYAMSAITALTAQNTTGVFGVMEATPEFVALQIDCVFEDIPPDAVKIGMVSNERIIRTIAERLRTHGARRIVVDPVMVATSGSRLLDGGAVDALMSCLMPLADLVTPNIPEAEVLSGMAIRSKEDMEEAGRVIAGSLPGNVMIKGGHLADTADDLLVFGRDSGKAGRLHWLPSERVRNPNTHGTGCTLSSAIACRLAEGHSVEGSVMRAKAYVTEALRAMLDLGRGSGPLDHMAGR